MLKRLFRREANAENVVSPGIPSGERVFAVGDIHGRLDLLDKLLAQIAADDARRGPAKTRLIFLGDLIDRGTDSAAVVDRLLALSVQDPTARYLLGNHEEVFLSVLSGSYDALNFFRRIGGEATIASYGIGRDQYAADDFFEVMDLLREAVPQRHIDFLQSFEDHIVVGDYVFVHAGIRPGVALANQKPEDLRWIRREFLNATDPFEKMVVHGHTVTTEIDERANRIGIDTGAYASGRLSAMGFEGDQRWVLQTGTPARAVA